MARCRLVAVSVMAVVVTAATAAGCGAAPEGRLGPGAVTSTTKAGTPVEVANTTTTGASVAGQAAGPSASTSPGDDSQQVQAAVDCLRSRGIAVPSPSTDSTGKVVYDEAALARIAQDPANHAAVQECAG